MIRQEDEQLLSGYFDSAPGFFYTLVQGEDGGYAMPFASAGMRDLFGIEPRDVARDIAPFVAVLHPEDRAMVFREIEASGRDLAGCQFEYRILHLQKGLRWIAAQASPQRKPDGGISWAGFMHDVTERKQMEESFVSREHEYRRQAQFQQSLLSGMRDAGIILVVVEEGHFVYTNDHYVGCKLGYAEGQLPESVDFLELIHPDDRSRIVEMHRDRLAGKPMPTSYEIGALGGDGSRREYEFHVTLVPDSDPPQTLLLALDIAGRKRTEMELQRREREFRTLVENTPDVVVRYDRECRRIYVNSAWEKANGIPAREVIGKSPQELSVRVKPISADFERMLRGVMETGRPDSMVLNWLDDAGGQVYFELNAIPEFDGNGAAVSVLTVARDITEHRRMEAELLQRGQEYRSLTENLPDNIARMDAAGRVLYSNPSHQRSLGKPAAEMVGKTYSELFPDGRYAPVEAAIAQVVATGQPALFVRQPVPFENGETRIHDVNLVPERDADGNVISVLGIGRDMTDIYRLQDEVGSRERELRALADSSPGMMGAFYSRQDGSVCMPYVSPNIEKLFGLRPQDVVDDASPLLALNHPDDAQRVVESIAESARNMTVWHEEYRILHPTRGERWMESHTRPEPHPDGGIVWYGYVHDITERKRIENILRRSEEMLAEAQKIARLGSWDWDVVADRVEWSEMAYEIYTPDKRPAEPGFGDFTSSLHPDDLDRVVAAVQAAFERDEPFDLDHRVVSASRGVRTVHAQGKVFRGVDGKPIRMVGTVQDISERKRIENVLRFIADPGNVENSDGFLPALARFLGEELGIRYVIIDRLADDQGIAETAALYVDGGIAPNMRYALKDTPCDNVIGKRVCCYPQGVQALFPQDELLVAMKAESYAGIPLWDSTGKPVGLIAVMDDAPFGDEQALVNILQLAAPRVAAELEREQSERLLKAREHEFRSLVENLPDIVVRYDCDARFVYVNPQFEVALGVSMEDLLGKTPTQVPGLPDAEFFEQKVIAAAQSGKAVQLERHVQTADGKGIWGSIRIAPEFDEDGQLLFVQVVTRDLSERKQAEIALKERFDRINELNDHLEESARNLEVQAVELEVSQEQLKQTEAWYRSIIHSAPEGMLVMDERGVITLVNAQLEAMFGYECGELPGCNVEVLQPQNLRENHVGRYADFFAGGVEHQQAMFGKTLFGCRKDGSVFPVDISLSRLPEVDCQAGAICVSVRDVTEREKMEAAREASLSEALRLAQLRSTLMAQMSHELRTPLNGILGYAQYLLQGEALDEKQIVGLNVIRHSGEHLLSLINGLLDHAAIEAGKFELAPGDIELDAFLGAIVGMIRIRAEQKNLAFACEVGPDLPAVVRGDAQRLRQVLLNLLANAVKFTDQGQVTLRVNFIAPSRLRFAVQDSGVGISADQLENIFKPFEQAGEIQRRASGTGLGLAISRKLVRLMGGDITVESRLGGGSTFRFEIEMEVASSGADKVNAAALAEQAEIRAVQALAMQVVLPRQELDILHNHALRGSMRDVMCHAEQLAGADERYRPFTDQVRRLAANFQTKALLGLIGQYRDGTDEGESQ